MGMGDPGPPPGPPPEDYGPTTQTTTDTPPQDLQAERDLVGYFLKTGHGISEARALGLDLEHFYDERLGIICQACADLKYVEGEHVDQVTVGDHLKRMGTLDRVGGVVELATLAADTGVVSGTLVLGRTRIILKHAAARSALEDSAELSRRIYDGEDPDEVVPQITHKLNRRTVAGVEEGWSSAGELFERLDANYELARERGGQWAGLDSGIPRLNDLTSGLCPEELTILGARPNIGKTTLQLRMATTIAEEGENVAIFTLEMSKEQCMQRLACIEAKIDLRRFRAGRLDFDEMERYRTARALLARLPLYFDHTPGLTIPEMQARYERLLELRGPTPLVLIDFIQLLEDADADPRKSETQKFTDIAKGLQRFTKTARIHTLAASQLSRAPEMRDDKRPRVSDLRESGGLEQAADNVWLLHRPGYYDDWVERQKKDGMSEGEAERFCQLIAGKTKFGPTGLVPLHWWAETGEFLVPGQDTTSVGFEQTTLI